MNPTLIASLHSLLAEPDRPDRDALFAVLDDDHASTMLACLAPPGSLLQIAAALRRGWSWDGNGWERHTNALVAMITDPRCLVPEQIITTWSRIPSAVGVLRDRTDALVTWAQQRLHPSWYAGLATFLGPSDASARFLANCPESVFIGQTLRRWSMATDPDDPTAWQAMIDPDLRAALHQRTYPLWTFPAWGRDNAIASGVVLDEIVDDLVAGWSPAHPSIRRQIAWIEHHVDADLDNVGHLAILASIASSDALADAVCERLVYASWSIFSIANDVPWSRLHPRIQTIIDETMRQSFDDGWTRTWACAFGQTPIMPDNDIDASLLLWRIAPERWNDLDPSIRAALVSNIILPDHCYGWGIHPDLVARRDSPNGKPFRFWNPDVPSDDLRAWTYADLLRKQRSHQDVRVLIAFLDGLPPERRARFEQIIDGRLGGRFRATSQPPWDWMIWTALPAADRQRHLRVRLRVLWGDRTTAPAYRVWRARSHLLDTVAVAVRALLDGRRAPHILAALLAQIPALRANMTDDGPSLPFPDDLDAALRAQIERLPLPPDAQAYAAWGLWLLARAGDVGADLIALHPDVAVALTPLLNADQQKAVAASPAAQGWDSMTVIHWAAVYEKKEESISPPIQRRIS